ncbi:MAG: aminopeptidase [Acidobacteriota bacterium]|nr:aminopeptidase [Acidobacteriota bacterium]MDH3784673.1 aminopeptidase [Acidobacteriota bacterium]
MNSAELGRLLDTVFAPQESDHGIALLVDLPDEARPDHPAWRRRRELADEWHRELKVVARERSLGPVSLFRFPNVRGNNADLPESARRSDSEGQDGPSESFETIFKTHSLFIAMTEFSATAPMKLAARRFGFRAATMPGFSEAMIPALRLDFVEIDQRCAALKARLDVADAAELIFEVEGTHHTLCLDLRHREATSSSGRLVQAGIAGNLPSGETYIVPYEGERDGDCSRTTGTMPLELDGELIYYRFERNQVVEVVGDGPVAAAERRHLDAEPGYRNLAELGLGVLGDYGIQPIGEILLDEKLGLHLALGRSDHFGGATGVESFSAPDKVVHIDRVYLPELQPRVRVRRVTLSREDPTVERILEDLLMQDGGYV